jgi:hypothetical protein
MLRVVPESVEFKQWAANPKRTRRLLLCNDGDAPQLVAVSLPLTCKFSVSASGGSSAPFVVRQSAADVCLQLPPMQALPLTVAFDPDAGDDAMLFDNFQDMISVHTAAGPSATLHVPLRAIR